MAQPYTWRLEIWKAWLNPPSSWAGGRTGPSHILYFVLFCFLLSLVFLSLQWHSHDNLGSEVCCLCDCHKKRKSTPAKHHVLSDFVRDVVVLWRRVTTEYSQPPECSLFAGSWSTDFLYLDPSQWPSLPWAVTWEIESIFLTLSPPLCPFPHFFWKFFSGINQARLFCLPYNFLKF